MPANRQSQPPSMTLEGVLGPNRRLDEAAGLSVRAPNALCVGDGRLLFSSGATVQVLEKWDRPASLWRGYERQVTALCHGADGRIAAGLEGGALIVCDAMGVEADGWSSSIALKSIVDCMFLPNGKLVVVDNGYSGQQNYLSAAPWDESGAGQVIEMTRGGETRVLARNLRCPMGLALGRDSELIVTEMEGARIVNLNGGVLRTGFPGYLGRLHQTSNGYLLACLGRRDPLIEFLKSERDFVAEMKASIAPELWIGPRANAEFSHDFPIELGATRLFGEIKPWAPSFSYGLVIELDNALTPIGSAHSRADGQRHFVTDAVEWNGEVIAASGASNELLNLGTRQE